MITEALNLRLPTWRILKDDINKVVKYFETLLYEKLKSECGTLTPKKKHLEFKKPRLLQRLENKKRELRRQFRKLKRQLHPDRDHIRVVHRENIASWWF